jgi:sugar/nucleoside kinase (ribokinase family)
MGTGLVCVGLTTLDVVLAPVDGLPPPDVTVLVDGVEIVPAGTAGGAAMVAATLGVKTSLAGAVGDDRKGRYVRLGLAEAGIDVSLLSVAAGRSTSTTVLAVDPAGRRPAFHALGAGHFLQISSEILAAAQGAKFVHWGGIGLRRLEGGVGADLLAAARAAGAVVTCDLIAPQPSALEELKRLLPHVDYFMPSAAEAFGLSGHDDLAGAADFYLGLGAQAVIIKNGPAGSYLALDDQRITVPAHVIEPVDTTSCGDSYCAGFIAALDRGWPVVEACRFATATAALVAQGLGTLGKLESFAATERAMRETPLRETA